MNQISGVSCMRKLLCVVMDGIGLRSQRFGNAVALAKTPGLNFLKQNGLFSSLKAHGTYVGLPGDQDIGNSEVGHNALGAGRIYSQGATLVKESMASGRVFDGGVWTSLMANVKASRGTLHFIGLLSDGNVHSHEEHLYRLLRTAVSQGQHRIRLHLLFDGRDVSPTSAEIYVKRLDEVIKSLESQNADIRVASGGGRMTCTMDRYNADWSVVERGWKAHVLGEGQAYESLDQALASFRKNGLTDQYFPEFVIRENGEPVGPVHSGDSVVLFNFRGDRAIEISRAFDEKDFSEFDRKRYPDVYFAGMMEYDGDAHIPKRFLVSPPSIKETLSEHLAEQGIPQFACSETQKFGHVTYFWNGNRSGYFDEKLEEYLEIPSDVLPFDQKPWMKAWDIAEATMQRMRAGSFRFGRINFANGDMVGHTGNLEASVIAVSVVDMMISKLIQCCKETNTILMVTADHGNCDEMLDGNEKDFPDWECSPDKRPAQKTSHTLAEVPLYLYDPSGFEKSLSLKEAGAGTLAGIANTSLELMGLKPLDRYESSLIISK